MVMRSPSLNCPPTGRAVGVRHPRAVGACVGVGAQHCPLGLHALWGQPAVAVVGGCPPGGWPATVVRGVWCQALFLPRPPALWGGQPGFRDPCVPGAVGAGVGPSTGPTACALADRRCALLGWRKGVSGEVPSNVVRGFCGQALSLPPPPVLWSGQPGFRDPYVPGVVGAGLGTQHRPHSVRPCGPALLAVGVAEGRPWGACLPPLFRGI